ncbi:MAG TPA: AAA family ATPase, partial [Bacillota bacterium]
MAKLYFRYSAMNAGKTTQLLQVKYNYEERGQNVLLLKPAIDNRQVADQVISRIGLASDAVIIDSTIDLLELVKQAMVEHEVNCLLIDEAQFITRPQVLQLCRIVD